MKKIIQYLFVFCLIIFWSSCRKDFDFEPASTSQISFSVDTIFMDTVFNRSRTSTKILSVYNKSNDDISINKVQLIRGEASKYQLNIDGRPFNTNPESLDSGKVFENVEILSKDSILVFIEATNIEPSTDNLDSENNYRDQISFETSNGSKSIELQTQVIDANFSFSEDPKIEFTTDQRNEKGEFIVIKGYNLPDDELTISSDKARVIQGYAVVSSGKTLTIDAGSRIFFKRDSGLIIEDGGQLVVNGEVTLEDEENTFKNGVIIEGSKIDEDFDNLPAQWNFIWIRSGGKATIKNTLIKNATTSLLIEGKGDEVAPILTLENVQIYNSQTAGIQANAAHIIGANVVINQNGRSSISIEEGGNYEFTHCTFSNTFSFGSTSSTSIFMNNTLKKESDKVDSDLKAKFINCIITGSKSNEISIIKSDAALLDFNFENCLIDIRNPDSTELNTANTTFYTNCIFNENPEYSNTELNDLRIDEKSAANGKASFITSDDILGKNRQSPSDIGAYESVVLEKEEEKN